MAKASRTKRARGRGRRGGNRDEEGLRDGGGCEIEERSRGGEGGWGSSEDRVELKVGIQVDREGWGGDGTGRCHVTESLTGLCLWFLGGLHSLELPELCMS